MYIKDKPCGEDLFNSSAHHKTANAIANIITNNSIKIDIIGLEGDWGSGKSNIIEMTKKQLGSTHHFFIYDAWGHQEDLQRRSFIEELTQNLCENEILNNTIIWEEKLENLLARKTKNITKTIPKLNIQFFILFLVLVSNNITNSINFNDFFNQEKSISNIIIFTLLNNLPVLSWILFKLFSNFKCFTKYKNLSYRERILKEISNLLQIYKNESLESTIETITSTREPSVREFKDWMTELSLELKKDLVVVFDNMDRLENDKAKNLWSSIHTFFSECDYIGIHTIVPFDRKQIRKIFDSFNENQLSENSADRFIDKTFELVFRVTPPVLTDWKKYFENKFLDMGFSCDDVEFVVIRNLYAKIHNQINPRDIILFLNELYLNYSIWEDEIPLRYIALFILNKNTIIANPINAIIGQDYKIGVSYYFDNSLQKYLSAIMYNVPPDQAEQVLLSKEILESINNNDINRFNFLSKAFAFDNVCENIFDEIENVEYGSTAIYKVLYKNEMKIALFNIANDIILQKFFEYKLTTMYFNEYIEYLIIMNPNEMINIFNHYFTSFSNQKKIIGKEYFDIIITVIKFIEKNDLEYDILNHLPNIVMDLDEAVNFVEVSEEQLNKYKITLNSKDLDIKIGEMITSGNYDKRILNSLYYFKHLHQNLKNTKSLINEKISSNQFSYQSIDNLYNIINAISNDYIDDNLIFDNNYICQTIQNNYSDRTDNLYWLLSMLIKKMFVNNARLDIIDNYQYLKNILNSAEEIVVDGVEKYIDYFMNIGDLFNVLITNNLNNNLIKKLILKKMNNKKNRLNPIEVIENYENIKNLLSINDNTLIEFISRWHESINTRLNKISIFDIIKSTTFMQEIISGNSMLKNEVLNSALIHFNTQKDLYFEKLFTKSEATVELIVFHFIAINKSFDTLTDDMKLGYRDALFQNLDKKIINPLLIDIFNLFYENINKSTLRTTLTNVRDKLISEIQVSSIDLNFYIPLILKHSRLFENADQSISKIIIPVLKINPELIINQGYDEILAGIAKHSKSEFIILAEKLRSLEQLELADSILNYNKEPI